MRGGQSAPQQGIFKGTAVPLNDLLLPFLAFRKGRAGVKTDGKWGLIDSAGKWICPPAYDDLDIL